MPEMRTRAEIERATQLLAQSLDRAVDAGDDEAGTTIAGMLAVARWALGGEEDAGGFGPGLNEMERALRFEAAAEQRAKRKAN